MLIAIRKAIYPAILLAAALLGAGCSSTKKEKNIVAAPTLPEEEVLSNAINTYNEQLFRVSHQSWVDLRDGYPTSYYSTLAEIKIADSLFYAGDYPAALVAYEEFTKLHPGHEAMPYVRYQIGNSHLAQYRDIKHDQGPLQSSIKAFQLLIEQHPRSEYVVLARRRLQKARELQAEYERYVAGFYEKRGLESAATSRLNHLSKNFPETQAVQIAMDKLPTDAAKPVAGKSPGAPKLFGSTELEAENYIASLSGMRARAGTSVQESNIETSPDRSPVKLEGKTEENIPETILAFDCEETDAGAVFIATLSQPLSSGLKRDGNSYTGTVLSAGARPSEVSCTAANSTVKFIENSGRLQVILPDVEAKLMLLNRPTRIVISIQ